MPCFSALFSAGLHTPLHTRYVRAPLHADGRIPIRGFTDWLPTAVGLAPDWAWFPDGYRDLVLSYRRPFDQTPPSRAHRPRYSAFPTAVGDWLSKGRRFASLLARGVESLRLVGKETTLENLLAPTSLATPARSPHAALRA